MTWSGSAWMGVAWKGVAWIGEAWNGVERCGVDGRGHRRTGTEIRFTSPWNSKSNGNSSPTEIALIRGS